MNAVVGSFATITAIARDVLLEAKSSRMLLVLVMIIGLFILSLVTFLNFEIVDGALAGARVAGKQGEAGGLPIEAIVRETLGTLAKLTFHMGLLFGIVATADVTPRSLQPGRVEHILSMPVRRTELVVGIFVGVCAICAVMSGIAFGGMAIVLSVKLGTFVSAPIWMALVSFIAFAAIYGVMIAIGAIARSAALSAGAGLFTYIAGVFVVSSKPRWLNYVDAPFRQILDVLTMPFPDLDALANVGVAAATGKAQTFADLAPIFGTTLAFTIVGVAVASAVVSTRDY